MRFGGHETFAIREGWLHKGLKLLIETPHLLDDTYAADWLGVGRNMAKSIRHWMLATGLAQTSTPQRAKTTHRLDATPFGHLLYEHDPYFCDQGTWWALHINLLHAPHYAATWAWFFNHFNLNRFEKPVCFEALQRHIQRSEPRTPSLKTLQRDLACLLQSYAKSVPPERDDPEEARDCPFIELGLLRYFRNSGYYQLNQQLKPIPPNLLGYAMSCTLPAPQDNATTIDMTFHDAARLPHGPGKIFVLTSDLLFEYVQQQESEVLLGDIQIAGLAGERVIRLRHKPPLEWLHAHFAEPKGGNRYAA